LPAVANWVVCLHNVRLHTGESYAPIHVVVGRNNSNGEFWAIASDEPITLKTFQEYGLRFDSEIRSVTALSRLWFIFALATLYVTAQSDAVVASGSRRWIDTHWFWGNSYFRIGWEWVKASWLNVWELICSVRFATYKDMKNVAIALNFRFKPLSMQSSSCSNRNPERRMNYHGLKRRVVSDASFGIVA
jgi:hypothetical protein